MKRLDKIKQTYQDRLASHIKDNGMDITVDNMFDTIVYNDPSHDKRYTRWLVETLLNDGYLFEDLSTNFKGEDLLVNLHCENNESDSKVTETLRVFMKHSRKLDIVDRSINRYQSIADIWKMVKQYTEDKTGHQVKREEYDKAMSESEMVIDNDDMRVIVPLTEYAAKFHGRGTRWCTAADNNNMFWDYAKNAPLFIITLKESGDKLQLWKKGNNIQFMDADDSYVSKEYIKRHWSLLKDIIKYIGILRYIPPEQITPELYELTVKQNGMALYNIPNELRTPELYELAVKQNGMVLKYVPEELRTPELCRIACQQNWRALDFVPDNLKTYELCKLAVEKYGHAFLHFSKEFRTPELCEIAVQNYGKSLFYVPYRLMTPELCKMAVEQNYEALLYVPKSEIKCKNKILRKNLLTPELCKIAVQQNGMMLRFIDKKYKTLELCMLAVQQNNKALEYVPKEIRSHESMKELISGIEELPKVSKPDVEHMIPLDLYDREISAMSIIAG